MNHHPSDDSANVPLSGQAAVADVRDGNSLPLDTPSDTEHPESYYVNPALQKALSCLDIKLADELGRFRATQGREIGHSEPIQDEDSAQSDRSASDSTTWAQHGADFDADAAILTAQIVPPAEANPAPKGGFIIIDGLTTSASSSRNANANLNCAPIALHRSDAPAVAENLDLNFSSGREMAQFHDRYLSSSQELLRQIQSGYPAVEPPQPAPAPRTKHFTPLKIGSMAVICALAGGAVYTYLNPGILAPLTATKVTSPSTSGQTIQSPNLAASEFTELNLSTLNTIKLPTVTATNITTAPTVSVPPPAASTAPAAIPFNGMRGTRQTLPTTTITAQPRLADSLVRSLLPPNFYTVAKPSGYRVTPPIGR
ncbi:hypothetical protein [Chamaesiphon sp. OTE_20_metabat_361]|uniref:hypothetical protein n=1 Tax=Chamaesiphon sp. OTE_20_metabat_361 TaxID=2964689 RepID=UPI00286A9CDB|nr:hypothetical protein [Chamaesiphon sp. OTE_20_metabat_361]